MVTLLLAGETCYDDVCKFPINPRVPHLECLDHDTNQAIIRNLPDDPSPRLYKTHLPWDFVEKWVSRDGLKTIVPLRDPRDVLVSLYYVWHIYKCRHF